MKKAPSDSPVWQLKKRGLLIPLSYLITKPIQLDLSNLHYGPHFEPHYHYQNLSPLANGRGLNRQKYAILQTHWH